MSFQIVTYNGSTYPTDANGPSYGVGDVIWNSAPGQGAPAFWICSVAGAPGTWIPVASAGGGATLTTTATSGTLSSAYGLILLNPATTGTYSLPNVTAYAAGGQLVIKNIASGSTTLTPLAANGYDAAAITLAQYAVVVLRSAGTTNWYKGA